MVRRAQRLGFTLAEIRELHAVERVLARLAASCRSNETLGVCPLLESLGGETETASQR